MALRSRLARAAACVGAALALAACASPVPVEPAEFAGDPGCAPVMLAIPDELGGLQLRATTSQATAAYGDDPTIIVRCGVAPPGPTDDRCVAIDTPTASQDWIVAEGADVWRAVSFGRSPAVEVVIPTARADEAVGELLAALSGAAALAEPNGLECR